MNLITKLIFATLLVAFASHVNFAQTGNTTKDSFLKEHHVKSFTLASKLIGPGYGASLYSREYTDTTLYYFHFFLEHFASKRSWKKFKFTERDTIIFVLENEKTMVFTDLDTAFNTFYGNAMVPNYNQPSVIDFSTEFEISKDQLNEMVENKLSKVIVRTPSRKLKSRVNGKRLSKKIPELYGNEVLDSWL